MVSYSEGEEGGYFLACLEKQTQDPKQKKAKEQKQKIPEAVVW